MEESALMRCTAIDAEARCVLAQPSLNIPANVTTSCRAATACGGTAAKSKPTSCSAKDTEQARVVIIARSPILYGEIVESELNQKDYQSYRAKPMFWKRSYAF